MIWRVVCSGELAAGAELRGVREYARVLGTTSSTMVRAYRYLAGGAVITLADRWRARVAGDGAIAATRLLEPERVFRLSRLLHVVRCRQAPEYGSRMPMV
ncbi:hypothetical protein [Parafrankia sp. EAN1pec]|uniref:hypothetical protein n=1 Tax=Parafrankia sp. (strain EAN1pec) TaxID=298653 RepID=UPI00321A67B8